MGLKAKVLYDLNVLRLRYWQKNKKLIEPLYKNVYGKSHHPGMVICMCDGRFRSGGLGDRIHGILSLYKFFRFLHSKIIFHLNLRIQFFH